jgi:peroxiredoxin
MKFPSRQFKMKIFMFWVIIFCFFACSCNNRHAESDMPGISETDKAGGFSLQGLDGNSVSLDDFLGERGVFLIFTTTWCPHCVTIIPGLKNIYRQNQGKNLEILAIYIKEPQGKVSAFQQNHALPYTVLLDTDGKVASAYNVRGVPTFVAIDKNGNIKYSGHNMPEDIIKEIAK